MKNERQGRARQFLPFAALRGFEDTVAEKRRLTEPRRELSESQETELSDALSNIKKGDCISVTHYLKDRYVTTRGTVTAFDTVFRFMKLGGMKIDFDDISELESLPT